MKVNWRQVYSQTRSGCVNVVRQAGNGLEFETIAGAHLEFIRGFIPNSMSKPFEMVSVFFLFHAYLFYVIAYTAVKTVITETKIKGNTIYPDLAEFKQKVYMFLTSAFVFHWLSGWTWGAFTMHQWIAWFISVRPQINIKPQIKFVQTETTPSISVEKVGNNKIDASTNLAIGLTPKDDTAAGTLRNLVYAKRTASFASDIFHSVTTGTASNESIYNGSNFSDFSDEDPDDEDDGKQLEKESRKTPMTSIFPTKSSSESSV